MSRRYDPAHKAIVLRFLQISGGNVALTSFQTGVPERTIRHWWQQLRSQLPFNNFWQQEWQQAPSFLPFYMPSPTADSVFPADPQPPADASTDSAQPEDEKSEFATFYERLLKDASTIAGSLLDELHDAPFNQRVAALTQIIDRMMKLKPFMPVPDRPPMRIEYRYPDGTIHGIAPWDEFADELNAAGVDLSSYDAYKLRYQTPLSGKLDGTEYTREERLTEIMRRFVPDYVPPESQKNTPDAYSGVFSSLTDDHPSHYRED